MSKATQKTTPKNKPKPIQFDSTLAQEFNFITQQEINAYQDKVTECHQKLHNGTGEGGEYTGWVHLPNRINPQELQHIQTVATRIRGNCDAFVVIGIGGSYLGAKAGASMLLHTFHNELPKNRRNGPKLYFAGHQLSSTYTSHLLQLLQEQEVSVNIISKSGTTLEPSVSFQLLKEALENKYGVEEAKHHIVATTDASTGILREWAQENKVDTFVVPNNIGGRYSVLTPVGLFPLAVAGIDIKAILRGAKDAYEATKSSKIEENECYQYAVIRNILLHKGKDIEILASFEPCMQNLGQWYMQLFGESEGKQGTGLFPTSLQFTTDLHSMGQYIQEGKRNLFETMLQVEEVQKDYEFQEAETSYYKSHTKTSMQELNTIALEGTQQAHSKGGVPNLTIRIPKMNAYYFGYLVYFFEKACGMSGYLLGVNPFNQPGVEEYKEEMRRRM